MAERGSPRRPPAATCQTRIHAYSGVERTAGDAALSACAGLYGRVRRKLFAEVAAGRPAASLKSEYLGRFGIPARMINGVRVSLEGKVASVKEQQKLRSDSLVRQVASAERTIAEVAGRGRRDQVHHKRRRLTNLKNRLMKLEADMTAGRVRLCFGSKRLWRKQHHLMDNGYASHEEWLQDWREARSGEFFVLGSRDETAGCQLCVASVAEDGTLTLRVRLPDCLAAQHGKHLVNRGVAKRLRSRARPMCLRVPLVTPRLDPYSPERSARSTRHHHPSPLGITIQVGIPAQGASQHHRQGGGKQKQHGIPDSLTHHG